MFPLVQAKLPFLSLPMNILSILTGEEGDVGKSMTPQVGRTSLEFSLLSYEQDDDQDIQCFQFT